MLTQDLRFGIRSFLRAPRFAVPAVVALALGIGATSAIFSVVRGVILKPLPYRDPSRSPRSAATHNWAAFSRQTRTCAGTIASSSSATSSGRRGSAAGAT